MSLLSILVYSLLQSPSCNLEYHLNDIKWHQISRATWAFTFARITRTNGEKYRISHAPSLYPSRSLAPSSSSFYSLCISNASIVLSNISIFWRRLLLSKQTFFVLSDTAKPDSSLELTFLSCSISVLEQRLEKTAVQNETDVIFFKLTDLHQLSADIHDVVFSGIFDYFVETEH